MDINSNKYTFIFSGIMVIVVATILALAAEGLKPFQKENVRREKMQNILSSVGVESTAEGVQPIFDKYIVDQKILNADGEVVEPEGKTAFDVDVLKEYKSLPFEERLYPLFVYEKEGDKKVIVPMVGKGLWGPVWGFVALKDDYNTVAGTSFDHKTETPGLGAEIKENFFEEQFQGKTIFDGGEFVSIEVVKGGAGGDPHGVDAISGGTITSKGVEEMIERTLKVYEPYFKAKK